MAEREWFIPSAIMTGLLGLAALLLMPVAGYHVFPPYIPTFFNWMVYSIGGGLVIALLHFFRLLLGKDRPGAGAALTSVVSGARAHSIAAAGMVLAGFDMIFFMWIKPEVTAIAPFWADPMLADLDHLIFGRDPWRFFAHIDLQWHAWAYSFFWAMGVMIALLTLLARRPSRARSTALMTYFAIWSIFGPLGQLVGSAAGPIFYGRIGLGDRFAEMHAHVPTMTNKLSDYLWGLYTKGELGFAAGISAMPSLHIATVTWVVLSFWTLKSRFTPVTLVFLAYIWAMSVALGWHYAVDGLAGALGAVACHAACAAWLKRGDRAPAPVPAGVATA